MYTELDQGNIPDSVHVDCTTQESPLLVRGKVELAALITSTVFYIYSLQNAQPLVYNY